MIMLQYRSISFPILEKIEIHRGKTVTDIYLGIKWSGTDSLLSNLALEKPS